MTGARLPASIGQRAARIRLLQWATDYVGAERMARALAIEPRSLRAKLSADRDVTDQNLAHAATALEARAQDMLAHARLVRGQLPPVPTDKHEGNAV